MTNINSSFDVIVSQSLFGIGAAGSGTAVVLGAVGRSVKVENRTLSLGVVMAAGSFGQFVMVPIVTYLIEKSGLSDSLLYLIFVASIMLIFSFALNFSGKSESSTQGTEQSIKEALKEAFQSKSFNYLTTGFFVCGFHVTFVAVHLPAFLKDESLPSWLGGWSLALIGLFNISKDKWENFKKSNIQVSEEYILKKIAERTKAKRDENFNLADKIRKDLLEQGVVIEDEKNKTVWKLK